MSFALAREAIFPLRQIGFLPSYFCPSRCRHCCMGSLTTRDDYRPGVVDAVFSALPESIQIVSLSGGELLARPRRALELVRRVSAVGRYCIVVSSGEFARQREPARRWLRRAAISGLDELALSVDAYHRPALSHAQRLGLVGDCLELGLRVNLKGVGRKSRAMIRRLERELDAGARLTSSIYDLEPVGRARRLGRDRQASKIGPCGLLMEPAVLPNGGVIACCSVFLTGFEGSDLHLGNVLETPLDEILLRHQRDYLMAALIFIGQAEMRSWLSSESRKKLPARIGCESCVAMLSDQVSVNELRRHLASDLELKKTLHGFGLALDLEWRAHEPPRKQRSAKRHAAKR